MIPNTEAELADMIASATAPLQVQGGGTRSFGAAAAGVDVLHTGALTGVQLYEPAALTLVARAGTSLAEVNGLLADQRQRLAFEPPDLRALLGRDGVSTIGGVAAANSSGPRRVQAGACRDSLIGVRFVDGQGRTVQNGGRVMKNVTGYDLVKLMAGSFGALGVLCEVSFKLQAMTESETTLVIDGLSDAQGLSALRMALGTPFDISGAARRAGQSLIRIEGMAGSVRYRTAQLRARLSGDVQLLEDAQSAQLWRDIANVMHLAGAQGDIWRLSVLPSDASGVVAQLGADPARDIVYDWGGGLIWAALPQERSAAVLGCVAGRGAAIKLRGAGAGPFGAQAAQVSALSQGLKAQFDPRGILNPGIL